MVVLGDRTLASARYLTNASARYCYQGKSEDYAGSLEYGYPRKPHYDSAQDIMISGNPFNIQLRERVSTQGVENGQ